ncbi:MAG TPA: hypothetical protein VMT17_17345 [Anaeromyxobacteraceae bacterium]|nr:hypothetical protein [Anaeromyxobacteraceae bacterium]
MLRVAGVAWLVVLGLSALGWGGLLCRAARRTGVSWPVTLGLGMAALVDLGGALSLLRLARRPVLFAVVAAGLAGLVPALRRRRPILPSDPSARREVVAALGLGCFGVGLAAATLVPPAVFNFHDDLQKYLFHPVWMMQTGTLSAGPTSALGVETFGGQAFLHGLVLAILPLPFMGALDAVLGFAALLCLAAAAGVRRLGRLPGAVVGVLLVLLVNPQMINISALYTAAALIATAVLLGSERERPPPLLLGAVYAAVAALKPTFALFPLLHLPLLAAGRRGESHVTAWALRTAGLSLAFSAPWVLLHLGTLLGPRDVLPPAPPGWEDPLSLLSAAPLFYGATALHYSSLGAASLLGATLVMVRRPLSPGSAGIAASAVAACAGSLVLVFVVGPQYAGREVGLRYSVPFLLGGAAPAALLALGALPGPARAAVAGSVAAVALAFAPSAFGRWRQALEHRTVLAYRGASGYRPYVEYAISDAARDRLRALQATVPEGAPLLAWVNWPFHLDLARNPTTVIEPTSFGMPWAHLPAGVRYLLWQRRGYATRSPGYLASVAAGPGRQERRTALRIRALGIELERLAASGSTLAQDGEFVVVDLGPAGLVPGPFVR